MLHFTLVGSSGPKYDAEAFEVLVPTKAGEVGIFEEHMPMISAAQPGVLSVRKKSGDPDAQLEHFAINGGILEVSGQTVRFVADEVTTSDEVNEQETQAALKRAETLMSQAEGQIALEEAHHLLRHSSAKLRLAQLKRRHHR